MMLRSSCAGRSNGRLVCLLQAGLAFGVAGCAGGGGLYSTSSDGPVGGSSDGPAEGEPVSFANHIQPILTVKCTDCHIPGGLADLAGIELKLTEDVSYALLVDQPSVQDPSLTLVVPGDAESSLLYLKISSDNPPVGLRMPEFAPALSQGDQTLIRDWIDQGAMEN